MTSSGHLGRVAYHDNIGLSLSSVSQIDRKNGTLIRIGSRLEFSKTVQVLAKETVVLSRSSLGHFDVALSTTRKSD